MSINYGQIVKTVKYTNVSGAEVSTKIDGCDVKAAFGGLYVNITMSPDATKCLNSYDLREYANFFNILADIQEARE